MKKQDKKATGCRLCKYRVSIPIKQGDKLEEKPSCCFKLEVNDKKDMSKCDFFSESDYYIKHPEEV